MDNDIVKSESSAKTLIAVNQYNRLDSILKDYSDPAQCLLRLTTWTSLLQKRMTKAKSKKIVKKDAQRIMNSQFHANVRKAIADILILRGYTASDAQEYQIAAKNRFYTKRHILASRSSKRDLNLIGEYPENEQESQIRCKSRQSKNILAVNHDENYSKSDKSLTKTIQTPGSNGQKEADLSKINVCEKENGNHNQEKIVKGLESDDVGGLKNEKFCETSNCNVVFISNPNNKDESSMPKQSKRLIKKPRRFSPSDSFYQKKVSQVKAAPTVYLKDGITHKPEITQVQGQDTSPAIHDDNENAQNSSVIEEPRSSLHDYYSNCLASETESTASYVSETESNKDVGDSDENLKDNDYCCTLATICSVANLTKEDLQYTPPMNFTFELQWSEFSAVFDEIKYNKMYKSVISKKISELNGACAFQSRSAPMMGTKTYFTRFRGYCKCGLKFNVFIHKKPKKDEAVKFEVVSTGVFTLLQNNQTGRQIKDEDRKKVFEELKVHQCRRVFVTNIAHIDKYRALHLNNLQRSAESLRTLKKEGYQAQRTDTKSVYGYLTDLKEQFEKEINPHSEIKGFIRDLGSHPLKIDMYRLQNLELYSEINTNEGICWMFFDATGGISKKIEKTSKRNLLYSLIAKSPKMDKSMVVAETYANSHNVPSVQSFLTRVVYDLNKLKKPSRICDICCIDFSWCLIWSCCLALNKESVEAYVTKSWTALTSEEGASVKWPNEKPIIMICSNHLINAFVKNLSRKNIGKEVKELAVSALCSLIHASDMSEFYTIISACIKVFQTQFEIPCKEKIELIQYLKQEKYKLNDVDLITDYLEQTKVDKKHKRTFKNKSPFYAYFVNARKTHQILQLETFSNESSKEKQTRNIFFSPVVLDILGNYYIPLIPFMSAMIPRASRHKNFTHVTTAHAESYFNILKNIHHPNSYGNVGDFVKEHQICALGELRAFEQNLRSQTSKSKKKVKKGLAAKQNIDKETVLKKKKNSNEKTLDFEAEENWNKTTPKSRGPKYLRPPRSLIKNFTKSAQESIQLIEGKSADQLPKCSKSLENRRNSNITEGQKIKIPGKYTTITDIDIALLCSENYLTDAVIDSYLEIVYNKRKEEGEELCMFHIMPAAFISLTYELTEPPQLRTIETCVDAIPNDVWLILIPVNVRQHYFLLVFDLMSNYVNYYDSLLGYVTEDERMLVIESVTNTLKIKFPDILKFSVRRNHVTRQKCNQCVDLLLLSAEAILTDGWDASTNFTRKK